MNVLFSVSSSDYIKYFLPMIQSAIDKCMWDGDFCLIVKYDIEWEVEQELK